MPRNVDQIRDERVCIENLVATTALRSELRLHDSSHQGLAAAHDPRAQLVRLEQGNLADTAFATEWPDIHRRFQVRYDDSPLEQWTRGQPARPTEKFRLRTRVVVGYHCHPEGDAICGAPTLCDDIAIEDLLLITQRLMHWNNRAAGTGTNVTRPSTDLIICGPPSKIVDTATRIVWFLPVESRIEITTEDASG